MTLPATRPLTVSLRGPPGAAPRPQGAPIALETGEFRLRSLTPSDANPRFLEWLNDGEMMRGLNLADLRFTLDQLRAFIAGFDNINNFLVGVFHRPSGLLVGFYTLDVSRPHKVGQITTGIGEKGFQGRGTLWATIDALLDHFYAERDIEKITARILARNRRMIFNFIGTPRFVFEARLQRECREPSGARLDVLVFASFKDSPAQPVSR